MTTASTWLTACSLFALTLPSTAQTIWVPVTTANAPSPRYDAAIAFDPVRDRIVLWGGRDQNSFSLADTWEFDGVDWTQRTSLHQPPYAESVMQYDRGRQRCVLLCTVLGGAETWEWDGVDWYQPALAHQPPAPYRNLMVYDSARGVMVAFVQGSLASGGQTWEYNGFDWVQRQTSTVPPPRLEAGMVFDPHRNRTILHGGFVNGGAATTTWEYDGSNWAVSTSLLSNPGPAGFAFAFDAGRRRAVLFGGTGGGSGTYEFLPPAWQLRTTVGPQQRAGSAMVYDSIRNECVLVGGRDAQFGGTFNDTVRYRALQPATVTPFGQGCAGTSVVPGLMPQPYHLPYVGLNFGVRLYSLPYGQPSFLIAGFSRTSYAGLALPLSLASIGMTGCQLFVSGDVTVAAAGSGASAAVTIAIPLQPALVGTQFYLQGLALDVGGNPANLIDTRALECRIGSM